MGRRGLRRLVVALCGMAAALFLVARGWPADQADASATAAQSLQRVASEWKAAYSAKDAAAVATLYAPDAYYVSAHVVAHGRPQIQAYFQRGIDAGGHVDALQILSLGHSGDLAYWVGTYEATNAGQKVRGRNIVVARKIGERWLIVAHESVVADQP